MQSDRIESPRHYRSLRILGLLAIIAVAAIVMMGVTSRADDNKQLKQWTAEQAIPSVSIITPSQQKNITTLDLPGRFVAYARAPIYARVNGYLMSWNVDIGAPVKAGQLLGKIGTPDLDQELLQARADLASTQANAKLSATTAKRWQAMLNTDAVSRQEVDDRSGDLSSKEAMVKAAQANVDRLLATKGFALIVAPFDGIVTARATDTGALINAGGAGAALFEVSDTSKLRLYVNVPQSYATRIHLGSKADITVPEQPGKTYTTEVSATSRAVDVASGTTLVQLLVNNDAGELLSGGFANVSLHLPSNISAFSIPSSALIFDQIGLRVATVGDDGKVLLKTVTIMRDLGKTIELGSGVTAGDRIIESPPDGIADGTIVHAVDGKQKQADASTDHKKNN
jgi:RND family efflux transporter MFP subunit